MLSYIVINSVYHEPIALFVCTLLKTLFVQIQEQAVIQEEQETKSKKKKETGERIRTATESSRAILHLRRWHSLI
jgi:ribosomal protein L34